MSTTRARAREDVNLLVLALQAAADLVLLCRLGLRLRIRADESKVDVLLTSSLVRPHIPLGVRHAPYELEERVSSRVIDGDGERLHRRIKVCGSPDLDWTGCIFVFLIVLVPKNIFSSVDYALNLVVGSLVLDTSQWLICSEVGDGVPEKTLDCGHLASVWRYCELKLGDDHGRRLGLDDLAVQVLPIEYPSSINRTLRCEKE